MTLDIVPAIELIAAVEAESGFMVPLLNAYAVAEPHYFGEVKVFFSSCVPGLDSLDFKAQGPLVRLFCAMHGADYVSTTGETSAERRAELNIAVERCRQNGRALFFDDLS